MLNAAKAQEIRNSVTQLIKTASPEDRIGRPLVVRLLDLEGGAYEMFFLDQEKDAVEVKDVSATFQIQNVPVDRLSTEVLFRFRSVLNDARREHRVKKLR